MKAYALKHPELRHRELAWRMVDEDVACLGASTVYRILRKAKLVCPWRRRTKRRREEDEKATRPDQIWATDIKYVWVGSRDYFLVCFLDEHELSHKRIKPRCPEENGLMERASRTIGEALEDEEVSDYLQAVKVIPRIIRWYNEARLHSALGFLRPVDYYRGDPETMYALRGRKLTEAQHRRREKNRKLGKLLPAHDRQIPAYSGPDTR